MESEKVKEIKEKLQEEIFIANSFGDKLRRVPTEELRNLFILIDELESENERISKENFVLYRDRFTKKELDDISAFRVEKATNELKDRIAELENGIAKSMLGCEFLPECTNEKLKQFATLLKVKTVLTPSGWCVNIEDIEKTLKEFIEK